MQPNEKIIVRKYYAECEEDSFENGIIGSGCSWTSNENPVCGMFDSVKDALKAVCDANYFTFNIENWDILDDDDECLRFTTDLLVDNDSSEASNTDIELWKGGKKRLWNCSIIVRLAVQSVARELTEDEISGWNK